MQHAFVHGGRGPGLVACAGSADDGVAASSATANLDEANNLDVQTVSAHAWGDLHLAQSAAMEGIPIEQCTVSNITTGTSGYSDAKADCTDALVAKRGASIDHLVEQLVWLRMTGDRIDSAVFRHWCGEVSVEVAVKTAAWDAPSLAGIGFYADAGDMTLDQKQTFYAKDDAHLKRTGEAKRKDGTPVYLYAFSGAGPCEINGSGDPPGGSVAFRPYVKYASGEMRWEAVSANHEVGYGAQWSRQATLLQ